MQDPEPLLLLPNPELLMKLFFHECQAIFPEFETTPIFDHESELTRILGRIRVTHRVLIRGQRLYVEFPDTLLSKP